MDTRRDVFQAIADPTRRDIIALITQQPMTPNHVAGNFKLSRQAISKHMKILTECGLLSLSVRGREIYYTLRPEPLAEVSDWLEQYREIWDKRMTAIDNLLQEMQGKTTKGRSEK